MALKKYGWPVGPNLFIISLYSGLKWVERAYLCVPSILEGVVVVRRGQMV